MMTLLCLALALLIPTASPLRRLVRPKTPRDGPRQQPAPLDVAADLELFAVCVEAGLSVRDALAGVASTSACSAWQEAAALLGVGAPMSSAIAVLREQPQLADLAGLLELSGESGAAIAAGCYRLVETLRAEAAANAVARAERAGVFIAVPLAVCFLPAFIVLGLVPVIISLGTQLL